MTSLRIGWATPWDKDSIIAYCASRVAFELNRSGHSVTVLRTEVGQALDRLPRPAPGAVHALNALSTTELRQNFDIIVAHIGNDYDSHSAILSRLMEIDCVGIFHDICVEPLVRKPNNERVFATSGSQGQANHSGGANSEPQAAIEALAAAMVGVITHEEPCARRLRSACVGPVLYIPPAVGFASVPPPSAPWNHLMIGVIGRITADDRLDQLIVAIAASPHLRRRCRIKIIGAIHQHEQAGIEALAQRLNVSPPMLTSHLVDDELGWQLRDVDVLACLNQAFSCCSASVALASISGRPALVARCDSRHESFGDSVLTCSEQDMARDIVRHLERLLADTDSRPSVSKDARSSAYRRHSPESYAQSVAALLEDTVLHQPERLAKRKLAKTLIDFGLPLDDPAVTRVETVLADLVSNALGV